ncbi:unnamed protein product, partial [Ascophyllum nodosum]
MVVWCPYLRFNYGNSFYRLRLTMGSNEFLGCHCYNEFFSIIPVIGKEVVMWIWGGFTVGNPTLNRFYSLHYLLPFLITGMVFVHLGLLHKDGSNNPLGIKTKTANINFYPYIYVKDLVAFFALVLSLSIFVFYFPNALG